MYARNFKGVPPFWLPGSISKITGPLSYEIQLQSGGTVNRHVDGVRRRDAEPTPENRHSVEDAVSDEALPMIASQADNPPPPPQMLPHPQPPAPTLRHSTSREIC